MLLSIEQLQLQKQQQQNKNNDNGINSKEQNKINSFTNFSQEKDVLFVISAKEWNLET